MAKRKKKKEEEGVVYFDKKRNRHRPEQKLQSRRNCFLSLTQSPPLSLSLSHTRARTHTLTLAHTRRRPPRTLTRTLAHALAEPLSCSLQFSGNEWGATQGTVVLANDLPGSHDALNVGWAGGWRQRSREPGSSVGSLARPASNYPGALPRGLQDAVLLPCSPQLRKPERCWGVGWGGAG